MKLHRRSFLKGLLAAPVIIRTPGLLMPIRPLRVYNPFTLRVSYPDKYYWEVTLAPTLEELRSTWNRSGVGRVEVYPPTVFYTPPGFMELLRADDVYPDLIHENNGD